MTRALPPGSRRTIPSMTGLAVTGLDATEPPASGPSPTGSGRAGTLMVDIRVAGELDDHWAAVLGDLVLIRLDDGTTRLTGPVVDQAQLHGILARVRDLGVPLLSLQTLHGGDCVFPRTRGSSPPRTTG
jgi:hypothetical protein